MVALFGWLGVHRWGVAERRKCSGRRRRRAAEVEEGAGGVRAGGAHFGSLLAKSGHVAKCSQQDIFFMNSLQPPP